MKRCISVVVALLMLDSILAEEPEVELPKPEYARESSEPDWLAYAAQFHGHLGPWATAGVRLGDAGRRAAAAEGYFDVKVVVEGPFLKPPRSCLLDGVQVATGATWGKRNIAWERSDAVLVRVTNTKTGSVAEVKPTQGLLELLTSFRSRPKIAPAGDAKHELEDDAHHKALEAIARKIARLPASDILTVKVRG
jgi:formylmethanofuran dehydrogenase subunit E